MDNKLEIVSEEKRIFEVIYYNKISGIKSFSHKYQECWDKQDYFCPNCGEKEVWCEHGPGDYYVGEAYLCIKCGHGFYLPSGTNDESLNEQGKQRLYLLTLNHPPDTAHPGK